MRLADFGPGLTDVEAAARLRAEGANELPRATRRSVLRVLGEVLEEPMLALLLAGGFVYLLLGDTAEALILLLFSTFSIVITVVQERRTERVIEALSGLAAPTATVIRDGSPRRLSSREVVRGDLLVLAEGDRVAADAVLLAAERLEADESLLTGESVPVRKREGVGEANATAPPGGDDLPFVYSGTMVTRGTGLARVTATGGATAIGGIGRALGRLETEAPRLRRQTNRLVRIFGGLGAAVAIAVVLLYGLTRGSWLEAVLAGIATGMSLLPEEFPVVLTVFLAMGAWRIAQAGVLTRRAAAIEALGAATVLCTDKTGTLTQNRMTVAELWRPGAAPGPARPDDAGHARLLAAGARASAPAPTDPMEVAFHDSARPLLDSAAGDDLVRSFALTTELLATTNVWRRPGGARLELAAKGAPEAIADLCRLEAEARAVMLDAAGQMAARGLRVLGVATVEIDAGALADDHRAHRFELLGLAGLADPLRPGVRAAVETCRAAGIRVVMVTGDYPATAQAIAAEAGIAPGALVTGADLARLDDQALAARIAEATVFARIMPEQKLRLVDLLQAQGEVVAMVGDGVNDAPALKAADIGVAMGKRGSDVAREAAAIILVEDDFTRIPEAVRLGRRIYDNIRKAMGFILAVHAPIAGLALLPLFTGLPILLGPIQVALLEMIIDPLCALVFEGEPAEEDAMRRPPRAPDEPLLSRGTLLRALVQGGCTFLILAALFGYGASAGMAAPELRTMIFLALVAAILLLALLNRTEGRDWSPARLARDRRFLVIAGLVLSICLVALVSPPVSRLLQFAPMAPATLALIGATMVLLFPALQLAKRIRR
jgi:Ca2+-transporting ATPase